MYLKPVLLEAPLITVFDWFSLALRAVVEGDVLLVELLRIPLDMMALVGVAVELEQFLERTHAVLTLADVNKLVVGRCHIR